MLDAHALNSLGLVLDIVGVFLLWKYGLPEVIQRTPVGNFFAEPPPPTETAKAVRYGRWSRFALSLIGGGFALQLVSNWI